MKKYILPMFTLTFLLVACNGTDPKEIAEIAYDWEKAYADNDYKTEQELIYENNTFEVHKTRQKNNSDLKYEDIKYEIYYDKESNVYYVFTTFKNPNGENTVEDELLIREKSDTWKIDIEESMKIDREEIKEKFEQEDCIHCEE
jgi:hypothetical protein